MDVNGTRMHLVLGLDDWRASLVDPIDEDVCYSVERDTLGLRPLPFRFPQRMDPLLSPGQEPSDAPENVVAARLTPEDRRGAATDRYGNWYWIGPDRRDIRFLMGRDDTAYRYWPVPEATRCEVDPAANQIGVLAPKIQTVPEDLELSGLAITADQYMVVGVLNIRVDAGGNTMTTAESEETSGLAIFDLHGGGPPVLVPWPAELGFRPFDMAALPEGGVAILDVADPTAPGPARLWQLDRFLRVIDLVAQAPPVEQDAVFVPKGPTDPGPVAAIAAPSTAATHVGQSAQLDTTWAVAIDALADGSVVILDRFGTDGRPEVVRRRCGSPIEYGIRVDDTEVGPPDLVCSDQSSNADDILDGMMGHDLAVVPGPDGHLRGSTLYIVDDQGDQAYSFDVFEDGIELRSQYHPLRLFGGMGLVADGTAAYYDLEDRWFPVPARANPTFARSGTIVLAPPHDGERGFDGGLPGTVWHRFVIDGSIPPGTAVRVESRAADDLAVLGEQAWQQEPVPYLRGLGSEAPFHQYRPKGTSPLRSATSAHQGSWEFLFQHCVGRFMQLRVTLQGDGRHTPRIWAVRAHFPRFSYLDRYLPDIYQADPSSASFLDRYLSNVEGMFTTFEGRISNVQRLLDPDTVDPEFLPWLASWVGAVVEPDWSEDRLRLFVTHASRMFARRGTQRGLIEAIRLATDECPDASIFDPGTADAATTLGVRVVEQFRTREAPGVVFGDPSELSGPRLAPLGDPTDQWRLEDGRAQLEGRWAAYAAEHRTGGNPISVTFPTLTPTNPDHAKLWHDFVNSELAVTYADVNSIQDLRWWQRFLNDRYRRIGDYSEAWMLAGASGPDSFSSVPFPAVLPQDGVPLQDWITFVSSTLPIRRNAHRFIVLVPIALAGTDEEREEPLGPVRRVVEANQPAHTIVEVKPYWGEFRVGAARVGLETIIGESGRYVDMVLGAERLAYGVIPGGQTWRLDDRLVVGRNRAERVVEARLKTGGST